jgi:formylglycine-generating enzyme required for sulfatase activity
VRIPKGNFLMGSPASEAERNENEEQHEVEITRPFYLGAYEVTQAQYRKIMTKNPSACSATGDLRAMVKGVSTDDYPAENIRWYWAVDFCQKLSALPAEKNAGRSYRLPTEAEWEYACRAATATPFHFGKALSSLEANFNGEAPYREAARGTYLKRPTRVGSYKPNRWGLYDMHGNVQEWCSDWYDPEYYKSSPKADPKGPAKGVLSTDYKDFYRVVRGGSWLDEGRGCRSAYRFRAMPHDSYRLIGFRVVCVVSDKGK